MRADEKRRGGGEKFPTFHEASSDWLPRSAAVLNSMVSQLPEAPKLLIGEIREEAKRTPEGRIPSQTDL
jgi:hypothetical protein